MVSSTRSSDGGGSDRVPPALKSILNLDIKLTKKFVDGVERIYPIVRSSTGVNYMKGLEISCHGISWFAVTLISIYLLRSTDAREIEINLFFGLIYDVMLVAFIKAFTRRNRPIGNSSDAMIALGPDKFSFPSGHASRAVWVALFFTRWAVSDMSIVFKALLLGWAGAVTISRVLMRRHHLLDVAAGVGLGFMEFFLSGILWVGPEACKWIGDWIGSSEDEFNG